MKCPYCEAQETKVINSRAMEDGSAIRRRRQCENCNERFTTYERIDNIPFMVVKRDGTRESFEKNKILQGIMLSCNKRPITLDQMEKVVTKIEKHIANLIVKEIESKDIGELVMQHLKILDEVAYVRFASVYKQFKDLNTFMSELSLMQNEKN